MSPPEARLWTRLRQRGEGLPVFRRQHPIGPYVIDFYCPAAKLAIEIDGLSHSTAGQAERDVRRDSWLVGQGIAILRIPAVEAMRDIDETLRQIMDAVRGRTAR